MKLEKVNCNEWLCVIVNNTIFRSSLNLYKHIAQMYFVYFFTIADVSSWIPCYRASSSRYVLASVPVYEFCHVDPLALLVAH